jgi:hypothetical protein
LLAIWIAAVYGVTSLAIRDSVGLLAIPKTDGDVRFLHGGIAWALGIYFTVIYVVLKPLYFYLISLSKNKLPPWFLATLVAPFYLFLSAVAIIPLKIQWDAIGTMVHSIWVILWFLLVIDPFNLLGKWISETDYFKQRIEGWRSYGSLGYYLAQYPPRGASDTVNGLIWLNIVPILAFVLQALRH